MNKGKRVYIPALDSVRTSDEEILAGQQALYDEVVVNGNIAVLSMNQLLDSRGFLSLLDDKEYSKYFTTLFKYGRIKISQHGNVRSLTQYFLDSIKKDFIYSSWPITNNQKNLMKLIENSLINTDLTEITDYIDSYMANPEVPHENIETLFEVDGQKSTIPIEKKIDTLKIIKNYLKNLYKIGWNDEIYIRPTEPDTNPDPKIVKNMFGYIEVVLKINSEDKLFNTAKEIIKSSSCYKKKTLSRSQYYMEFAEMKKNCDKEKYEAIDYAKNIIDVCYNFTCELHTRDISLYYDYQQLLIINEKPEEQTCNNNSFIDNFFKRLREINNIAKSTESKKDESIKFKKFEIEKFRKEKPFSLLESAIKSIKAMKE